MEAGRITHALVIVGNDFYSRPKGTMNPVRAAARREGCWQSLMSLDL